MPQTRFVTKKALALGLQPDPGREQGRPARARARDYVVNAAFDLFDKLGATDEQLDFPVVYASGINGWASMEEGGRRAVGHRPVAAVRHDPRARAARTRATPTRRCSCRSPALDYSSYVGRIGVGRINQGTIKPMKDVLVMAGPDGTPVKGRVNQVLTFEGLERVQATEAGPGDIVLINGIEDIGIGVTLTDPLEPGAAADAQGRRADADDELLRQHSAAGRPRRQVRHQPPDLGPAAEGTAVERRAARAATPTRKACSRSWAAANCT